MNASRKLLLSTLLVVSIFALTGCKVKVTITIDIGADNSAGKIIDYENYRYSDKKYVTINGDITVDSFKDIAETLNNKEDEIIEKMEEYGYKPTSVTSSANTHYDRKYMYTILFEKINNKDNNINSKEY